MAHKTLIGGTDYEINGGETLIDGTAYLIKNGKTLVSGTAYDVSLGELYYISGYASTNSGEHVSDLYFDSTCGYVVIKGIKYTSAFNNIPIRAGTEIYLKVSASHSDQTYRCSVTLNGTVVQEGEGEYHFTPTNDCTIQIVERSIITNWTYIDWWQARITM